MAIRKPIRAVFPGMFDPITNGHLDIIKRAAVLVDELIVAVGNNPAKQPLFSTRERVEMIQELLEGTEGVRVEAYEGLTADFVKAIQAKVLIRGIRDNVDLHYELEQANINMVIGEVETVFLLTRDQFALTSSTYIKQIVELGCLDPKRLTRFVPLTVAHRLREKLAGGMPAELSSSLLRPRD
ncbi:MAG TPA: pantetheine-phosphate adenylyltransferase [Phycisphaerae bacterium]|jgi:pantetheine-phosphate adenylyltransferase|nr:pantetheine-phosphate adenylyltransferase [Phycisphaerae bacterium]HOB72946.1 pantetheine-phosphate adenylyltransferase [Phycisphaerae bacterium]HOJ53005.1 pantetheine-phosphate adenylyltransferase [Phycisphaerae bacterium]HOL24742.1 pantetheine-phosphate adenylyltransferase [Phycisphaerae bacterium]HPP19278.1 pantetheine-phosphate adenylyltransferase [Phycisphaerae bacterium]